MRPAKFEAYAERVRWYLASLDLAVEAALAGIRHSHPGKDPWKILKSRWQREDNDRRKATIRMIRAMLFHG